jgi:hypothetical protein
MNADREVINMAGAECDRQTLFDELAAVTRVQIPSGTPTN